MNRQNQQVVPQRCVATGSTTAAVLQRAMNEVDLDPGTGRKAEGKNNGTVRRGLRLRFAARAIPTVGRSSDSTPATVSPPGGGHRALGAGTFPVEMRSEMWCYHVSLLKRDHARFHAPCHPTLGGNVRGRENLRNESRCRRASASSAPTCVSRQRPAAAAASIPGWSDRWRNTRSSSTDSARPCVAWSPTKLRSPITGVLAEGRRFDIMDHDP